MLYTAGARIMLVTTPTKASKGGEEDEGEIDRWLTEPTQQTKLAQECLSPNGLYLTNEQDPEPG